MPADDAHSPSAEDPAAEDEVPAAAQVVGLFATCVVNAVRPQAAFAALKLLRAAGCTVEVPDAGCCGQPAFNAGYEAEAHRLARAALDRLLWFDAIVAPSASCAGMLRNHLSQALGVDVRDFSERCFELCAFLLAVGAQPLARRWRGGPVLWHDSCASLREVPGTRDAALALLGRIEGLQLVLPDAETRQTCCGFGGLFSIKQPELSVALGWRKIDAMLAALPAGAADADEVVLTGPDMGCLMHLGAVAEAAGVKLRVMHVAEILAGDEVSP